jgi:hypothetical protein
MIMMEMAMAMMVAPTALYIARVPTQATHKDL